MRSFLYFLSFLFFIDCVLLWQRKSITLGFWIMVSITVFLSIVARYWVFIVKNSQTGILHTLKILFIVFISVYVLFVLYFLSFGRTNVKYNEDAVIVLGCGLNTDGSPSNTLKNRLDGCINYWNKNPNCYIVVSGAKSRNCELTEAQGMNNYLLSMGIPSEKILLEESATTTRDNFKYSKILLEKSGIETDNIVYVTNSFHVYRSGIYAKQEGFNNISRISVKTDIVVYIPAVIRESVGVLALYLFNY